MSGSLSISRALCLALSCSIMCALSSFCFLFFLPLFCSFPHLVCLSCDQVLIRRESNPKCCCWLKQNVVFSNSIFPGKPQVASLFVLRAAEPRRATAGAVGCLNSTPTTATITAKSVLCSVTVMERDALAIATSTPRHGQDEEGGGHTTAERATPSPVWLHNPPVDDASAYTEMAMRSGSSTSLVRKVSFACTLQVFDVEKLCFADLRGDVRDLSGTCEDPDWCSIGVARANKLAAFAENFMLRKVLCVWRCSADQSHGNVASKCVYARDEAGARREHRVRGTDECSITQTAATLTSAHRDQLAASTAAAARLRANCSINLTTASPAHAYYMYSSFDPFVPSFPHSLDTVPTRVPSDEDDDWSDWDSECSSVRQSVELLRSQS